MPPQAQHERSPGTWLPSPPRGRWTHMSSARVGCMSRGCCGTVWFCQVGVRTYLRSHQAPPEEMSLPLTVHLTATLSGTNPMCK
eukprot:scaffold97736_cov64-Phaeocystis_antarctica.AAC.5